jgi:PadR family transcriptional regulator, regulatory protein PadR
MPKRPTDLFQGTLDMLLLKALLWGPRHGYEVMNWIHQVTQDGLRVEEGALYPALHRMEARGLVTSEWGISESGRQAKFYSLTGAGRRSLDEATSIWLRYVASVAQVIEAQ